jgi:hypothetical protein
MDISTLVQWILYQVPVLETSLDSTWTLETPNDDWMSKFWPKKPPKSTEGEIIKNWLTKGLGKNFKNKNLRPICLFISNLRPYSSKRLLKAASYNFFSIDIDIKIFSIDFDVILDINKTSSYHHIL